jgi:hypothetical protein
MKRICIFAAVVLATAGAAVAQTKPGGNVPTSQGPCARGYEASVKDGRMQLGASTMKSVDTNSDGRISKVEFDAACTKKLFDQQEKRN